MWRLRVPLVLVLALALPAVAGCLGSATDTTGTEVDPASDPRADDRTESLPREEILELTGRIDAAVGAPPTSATGTLYAGHGKPADMWTVDENVTYMVIDMAWESPVPWPLTMIVQEPDGTQHTVGAQVDTNTQRFFEVVSPEPGDWYVGVSPVGATADVEWAATVTLLRG